MLVWRLLIVTVMLLGLVPTASIAAAPRPVSIPPRTTHLTRTQDSGRRTDRSPSPPRPVKTAFPNTITFSATVESSAGEITGVRLFYRPASSEVTNLSAAAVQRGRRVDLSQAVDMRQQYLPPGLDVVYYWVVTDSAGNQVTGEQQRFLYQDDRFPWCTVTSGQVSIYYYSGNDDFGRDLLDTATRTIQKLNQRFGVGGSDPIYRGLWEHARFSSTSLPPNSAEWIGGQAHPDLGLIVTGIQPGGGAAAEIRRVLPHEISHLLLYQATKNPYGGPPHWLDEAWRSTIRRPPTHR